MKHLFRFILMICILAMVSCTVTSPFKLRPDEMPVELAIVPMEEIVPLNEHETVIEEPVELVIEEVEPESGIVEESEPVVESVDEPEPEPIIEPEPITEPIQESVPEPATNLWVGDVPDFIVYLIAFCFLSTLFALCYVAKQRKEAKWHMFHS